MNHRDEQGNIVWPWMRGYEVVEYTDGSVEGRECYVWPAFLKAQLHRRKVRRAIAAWATFIYAAWKVWQSV